MIANILSELRSSVLFKYQTLAFVQLFICDNNANATSKLKHGEKEKKNTKQRKPIGKKNKNKLKLAPQRYSSAKNSVRVLIIEPPITFSLSYCALSYYASSFLYFYVVTKRLHIMNRILFKVKLITISKTVKDFDY